MLSFYCVQRRKQCNLMSINTRILIYKKSCIYDNFVFSLNSESSESCNSNHLSVIVLRKRGFDAHFVSAYLYFLKKSKTYRNLALSFLSNFLDNLKECRSVLLIRLRTPKRQFLDHNWSHKINTLVLERQELDNAMSWLSTLGGAFSALGDQFDHCAKIAGKISVKQFKLSLRLGDPQLAARCKLYLALSLLQQGHLERSAMMIREVYKFAGRWHDARLQNMCKGVWAKLQYCHGCKK